MTFLEECIRDSIPVWEQCLRTEFLQKMAAGELDEECLKGYIVDDSLYLREYARVFAWGIIRAECMEEIRVLHSLLAFVNENEDAARLRYLSYFKLTDGQIQTMALRAENQAYIDTMIEAARNGRGAAECLMACLPCMLSYSWIFTRMVKATPGVLETLSGAMVEEYAAESYAQLCRQWTEAADEICRQISPERRRKCREVFRKCSEHELEFWNMSARKREDL